MIGIRCLTEPADILYLIEAGADVNATDNVLHLPLHIYIDMNYM